jgi:metal-dependent amidase/aminoacylase/carboxypeptidase family protein
LEKQKSEQVEETNNNKPKNYKKEEKRRVAEIRQQKSKATSKLKSDLERIEEEIAKLEEEKLETEQTLADPSIYNDAEKVKSLKTLYSEVQQSLELNYERWTDLSSKLESIEKEFDSQLSNNS